MKMKKQNIILKKHWKLDLQKIFKILFNYANLYHQKLFDRSMLQGTALMSIIKKNGFNGMHGIGLVYVYEINENYEFAKSSFECYKK